MADGCINTHMARLLGAPPLLDLYGIFRGCLLCGKNEINKLLCAGCLIFLERKQHLQDLHISITNIRHNF